MVARVGATELISVTAVRAEIADSPIATPISAVTSGSPAINSEPKLTSSTTKATTTPITSAIDWSPSLELTTPPENSTCRPASRAGSATRSSASFVESFRSSTGTEKWRSAKPIVRSRDGVKPSTNCSPVVTACGTFCARSTVGSTTSRYCGSSSVCPFRSGEHEPRRRATATGELLVEQVECPLRLGARDVERVVRVLLDRLRGHHHRDEHREPETQDDPPAPERPVA